MKRRDFLLSATALALTSSKRMPGQTPRQEHHLPLKALHNDSPGVLEEPVPEYRWAPESAYEAFRDMKFGARIHWGMYSFWHTGNTSWPFLGYPYEKRQQYNELYKQFRGFQPGDFR